MVGDIFFLNLTSHFTSELQLKESIKSGLKAVIQQYYIVKYLKVNFFFKNAPNFKPKLYFEFDIDETTFRIDFPPFNYTPNKKAPYESLFQYVDIYRAYFDKEIDNIISQVGDFEGSSIKLTDNIFEKIKPRLIDERLETVFKDIQAVQLCRKISSPFTRIILQNATNNILEIHQIAMKCFNKYGGHIITFLLSLPELKFANQKPSFLTNHLQYNGEIPSLKIKIQNGTEYFICFHQPKKRLGKQTTVAIIYNKKSRTTEGHLTMQGYIETRIQAERMTLHIFVENIKKPTSIFSGVELGRCIYCNQELTDIKSLRNGYGKDCAQTYNLNYE